MTDLIKSKTTIRHWRSPNYSGRHEVDKAKEIVIKRCTKGDYFKLRIKSVRLSSVFSCNFFRSL